MYGLQLDATKEEVAAWIIEKRNTYTDREINDMINDAFEDDTDVERWTFGFCREVDSIILGKECYGGYWRKAYNWPTVGCIILDDYIFTYTILVKQSGFFTFAY